jgi:acyl carrier protein
MEGAPVAHIDQENVLHELILILQDMTSDWELEFSGGITPETGLIRDLTFQSIDMVQLLVAIEERFKHKNLPFEKLLMTDGRYVEELRVEEVADFLFKQLSIHAK